MSENEELEFETPLEEDVESIEVAADRRKIYTELGDPEIESLHGKFKRGRLIVQPDFQRQFVWDSTKASRLIESALQSVPKNQNRRGKRSPQNIGITRRFACATMSCGNSMSATMPFNRGGRQAETASPRSAVGLSGGRILPPSRKPADNSSDSVRLRQNV